MWCTTELAEKSTGNAADRGILSESDLVDDVGGTEIFGENGGDFAGNPVASLGYFNGDGHPDVAVGAPLAGAACEFAAVLPAP